MDWTAFWATLADFATAWQIPLYVVGVVIGAILLRAILRFAIRRTVERVVNGVKEPKTVDNRNTLFVSPIASMRLVQRTRTLGSVLTNIVTTAITIVAILLVFNRLVPEATGAFALITAALGAGLGFGAQNLVKDILNGLFMVAEDQLGVGDVVDVGSATGVVEAVDIRVTQVRDVNGTLWFVRNGEILRVGNMSQGWARVIIDLAVPYEADVEAVQATILATAIGLSEDASWVPRILEKPEIWGIESISAEAIVVRLVVKTASTAKDDVARELRGRLKRALDDMGVRLPALNSIVLSGFEGSGSARGVRTPKTRSAATQQVPSSTRKSKETP